MEILASSPWSPRSPSTSFEHNDDTRARAAADLSAIPAYPTSSSAANPSNPSTGLPMSSQTAYNVATLERPSNQRTETLEANVTPSLAQSAPGSSLTSSATSSRFGALSLEDEMATQQPLESSLPTSNSPASTFHPHIEMFSICRQMVYLHPAQSTTRLPRAPPQIPSPEASLRLCLLQ